MEALELSLPASLKAEARDPFVGDAWISCIGQGVGLDGLQGSPTFLIHTRMQV